jgi:hypothetical protein
MEPVEVVLDGCAMAMAQLTIVKRTERTILRAEVVG